MSATAVGFVVIPWSAEACATIAAFAVASFAPLFTVAELVQLRSAASPAVEQLDEFVQLPKLMVLAWAVPAKSVTPSARASFRISNIPLFQVNRLRLPFPNRPIRRRIQDPKRSEADFTRKVGLKLRVHRPGAPSHPVTKARPGPSIWTGAGRSVRIETVATTRLFHSSR